MGDDWKEIVLPHRKRGLFAVRRSTRGGRLPDRLIHERECPSAQNTFGPLAMSLVPASWRLCDTLSGAPRASARGSAAGIQDHVTLVSAFFGCVSSMRYTIAFRRFPGQAEMWPKAGLGRSPGVVSLPVQRSPVNAECCRPRRLGGLPAIVPITECDRTAFLHASWEPIPR